MRCLLPTHPTAPTRLRTAPSDRQPPAKVESQPTRRTPWSLTLRSSPTFFASQRSLDPVALLLTDGVAGMTGGGPSIGTRPPRRVLGHMGG